MFRFGKVQYIAPALGEIYEVVGNPTDVHRPADLLKDGLPVERNFGDVYLLTNTVFLDLFGKQVAVPPGTLITVAKKSSSRGSAYRWIVHYIRNRKIINLTKSTNKIRGAKLQFVQGHDANPYLTVEQLYDHLPAH